MPGELPGESTLFVPTATAVAIVPVPLIVPWVNVIGRLNAVAELYLNSAVAPSIVIPLVVLIRPVEPISRMPSEIRVAPV
jgi:hypothetical protein